MQRKKYRDYSEALELGQAFQIVKSSGKMRKLTMKRLIKLAVVIVFGYIVVSVYLKYRIANSKADNLQDKLGKDIGEKDTLPKNKNVKDQVNKVLEDYKREQAEKANKNVLEARIQENNPRKVKDDNFNDEEERKIKVEVVDRVDDVDDDGNKADFIKIDQDKVGGGLGDAVINPLDKKDKMSDKQLEVEIEERLAEAFKDAANEAEEERQETEKEMVNKNKEEAEKIEEKLEQKEFKDVARNLQKKLGPLTIEDMKNDIARRKAKHDDDHEFPPFVTAVRQTMFDAVLQLIYSIQLIIPEETIHVYDLDLDTEQKKQLLTICNVKVQLFMIELFPPHFSNLDNFHWKPLVIQTALAQFGHIFWINPGLRLASQEFAQLVHDSHDTGIFVISQAAGYSTFAVTHPNMLKFIQVDPVYMEKLKKEPHLEIQAMIIHNTPEIHENFMKLFTACAMEESCLAPSRAKWQCTFDFTGRKYANCHRYDESAVNILLKNYFKFNTSLFARSKASMFRKYEKERTMLNKLKYCRDQNDIRDNEL